MKKLLYGTTALAASALLAGSASAAERIKLGLGGYFNSAVAFGDADNSTPAGRDFREHGFSQESEIYFSGKTTLDNGIEFGVMVQLEGETSTDQIDNTFIWMESGFGRIEAGENWGPSLQMSYGSVGDPLAGPGGFGDFGSQAPLPNFNGLGINTYGGDAGVGQTPFQKITYYTPRIAGFQLGLSYGPDRGPFAGTCAAPAAGGLTNVSNQALHAECNGTANELIDIGVNFVQKFGDFDVAVFGSWFDTDTEKVGLVGASGPDIDGWSVGGQVGFMGFRVGGRYTEKDDVFGHGAAPTAGADTESWRIGVDYRTGPWMVGIAYHESEAKAPLGVSAKTELISTGARYTLGPGITLYGGIQFWDFDVSPGVVGGAGEGDPTVAIFGTVLQF